MHKLNTQAQAIGIQSNLHIHRVQYRETAKEITVLNHPPLDAA